MHPFENQWKIYILECSDKTYYIGITNNVMSRICAHNAGSGAKYTRGRLPVRLIVESCILTKSQALKHEYRIKQLKKDQKVKAIKDLWMDYISKL